MRHRQSKSAIRFRQETRLRAERPSGRYECLICGREKVNAGDGETLCARCREHSDRVNR